MSGLWAEADLEGPVVTWPVAEEVPDALVRALVGVKDARERGAEGTDEEGLGGDLVAGHALDPTTAHAALDGLERAILRELPLVDLPLVHRFTPRLYVREIFMPAGTVATSKIHKTEHPFVILRGRVSVFIPGQEVEHLEAPYVGITKPGTRRALYMHEDTVWLTFHPLVDGEEGEADLAKIETRIIERRELPDGSTMYDHWQTGLAAQKELPVEEELRLLAERSEQLDYGGAP